MPGMVRYRIEVDGAVVEQREALAEVEADARVEILQAAAEHAQKGHSVAVYRSGKGWAPPMLIYFAPASRSR